MRATVAAALSTILLWVVPARAQDFAAQGHCIPTCGSGYVCALNGNCVRVSTSDTLEHSTEELAERQQSTSRCQQARHMARIRLELDYQHVSIADSLSTNVYGIGVGLRKQLREFIGIAVRVGGSMGSMRYARADNSNMPSSGNVFEAYAELLPYFGPFGRFYAAPALLAGYRGYSVSRLDVYSTGMVELKPKWLHEIGGRLGLLLFEKEQLDLSIQLMSWPETPAPSRLMGAIAIEFL